MAEFLRKALTQAQTRANITGDLSQFKLREEGVPEKHACEPWEAEDGYGGPEWQMLMTLHTSVKQKALLIVKGLLPKPKGVWHTSVYKYGTYFEIPVPEEYPEGSEMEMTFPDLQSEQQEVAPRKAPDGKLSDLNQLLHNHRKNKRTRS